MALNLQSTVTLSSGYKLPILGLGVYMAASGEEAQNSVKWALEEGYRHVDTAKYYNNEEDVGKAVRDSGLPREDIFVTTKIWNEDQGFDNALRAGRAQNAALGLGYIDLLLIHAPVTGLRLDTYRALEQLVEEKVVRSIGVSNYGVKHLEELLAVCKIRPTVNQIEVTPYNQRNDIVKFCKEHNIVVQAYSPLTQGIMFSDPRLETIGKRHNKSPAQVLIRWGLQTGLVSLPKSVRRERIVENKSVFDFNLTDEDLSELAGCEDYLVTGWDPTTNE